MNAILPPGLLKYQQLPENTLQISAVPHPFRAERRDYVVPVGLSIAEIVQVVQADPVLRAHGVAFVGDTLVPREMWAHVRPKHGCVVSIKLLPGGGGGFMRIFATLALTALVIAVATFVPGGVFIAPLIAIGGGLLLNKLLPPPMPQISKNYGTGPVTYAINSQRNAPRPWAKVPFICGRFRVVPAYAALPYREVVGGDIYWRALFAVGHGPLHMGEWRIGETAIENFQGIELEYRRGFWSMPNLGNWDASTGAFPGGSPQFGDTYTCTVSGSVGGIPYLAGETITHNGTDPATVYGWDKNQDKPFALFPSDVFEDSLAVKVPYGNPQTRTSQAQADELGVELIFERGIVHLQNSPPGKRSDSSMVIAIQQAPTGTQSWTTVLQTTITGRQTTPLYWGHRWRTIDFGTQHATRQYDVRVHNLSGDRDEERNFGNFSWYALRTFTMEDPVPVPAVAMIAIRVKASGQLSGALDEFNVVAHSMCRDWDSLTATWKWRPTSSPPALYRHVLQHPARQKPLADAQIDIDRLTYWDSVTRPANRNFNGVFDSKSSLYDALVQICRVGRGVPSVREMRFSVIIDEPKTVPVRMFTPSNSWDYHGEMSHMETPNAYRIGFVNKDKDYTPQEVLVYDDGFHAGNAVTVDLVQWPGIDNNDQAWKEGRFHLAQQRLRRETHKITTDFEHLCCERGDLVALQYDTIAVGLGSSRIVEVTEQGALISSVRSADAFTMTAGKSYNIRVRRISAEAQRTDLYALITDVGTQTTLRLAAPPAIIDGPRVGDLLSFGEAGRESMRVILRDIEPKPDLSAVLTLISEAAGVHVAEFGPIPPWDPVITAPLRLPAPLVLSVASDARVMQVTASRSLIERVVFALQPIAIDGVTTRITYRLVGTSSSWQIAAVQEESVSSVAVSGISAGESYDFRIQYTHPGYLASPMTAVNSYYVVGRLGAPADLANLTIGIIGGQALLRWDPVVDLDVQIGGWIMFRHTPDFDISAQWPNTNSIAQAVIGDQTHVFLPLMAGTYFARVYDADGRASPNVSQVSTKQAALLDFSPVNFLQEDPTFAGVKTGVSVFEDGLTIATSDFDSVANTDLLDNWDVAFGVGSAGLYEFAAGIDFGAIRRMRMTTTLRLIAVNVLDFWDSRSGDIDSWGDIDGTSSALVDASVYGKFTDDDPGASPAWGAFTRIDSLEVINRAVGELECRLASSDPAYNLWVTQLRVSAEEVLISPDTINQDIDGGGPAD